MRLECVGRLPPRSNMGDKPENTKVVLLNLNLNTFIFHHFSNKLVKILINITMFAQCLSFTIVLQFHKGIWPLPLLDAAFYKPPFWVLSPPYFRF